MSDLHHHQQEMVGIRSADKVDHTKKELEIHVDLSNFQQKLQVMKEDRNNNSSNNNANDSTAAYSTRLFIHCFTRRAHPASSIATLISLAPGKLVQLDLEIPDIDSDPDSLREPELQKLDESLDLEIPDLQSNDAFYDSDFATLANELSKLVHLKKMSLKTKLPTSKVPMSESYCRYQQEFPETIKGKLHMLGQALTNLPQLVSLSVSYIPHNWYITQIIRPLLQQNPHPILKHLWVSTGINDFCGNYVGYPCVPDCLFVGCSCLTTLTLVLPFRPVYIAKLGQAIGNSTSISEIKLGGFFCKSSEIPYERRNISLDPLTEALKVNSSLRQLSVFSDERIVETGPFRPKLRKIEIENLVDLLKDYNFDLEELELCNFCTNNRNTKALQQKIEFYLSLNKAGRGKLMRNTYSTPILGGNETALGRNSDDGGYSIITKSSEKGLWDEDYIRRLKEEEEYFQQEKEKEKIVVTQQQLTLAPNEDWFRVLSQQDNISIIFYFLRANPALCNDDKGETRAEKIGLQQGGGGKQPCNQQRRSSKKPAAVPRKPRPKPCSSLRKLMSQPCNSTFKGKVIIDSTIPSIGNAGEMSKLCPKVKGSTQRKFRFALKLRDGKVAVKAVVSDAVGQQFFQLSAEEICRDKATSAYAALQSIDNFGWDVEIRSVQMKGSKYFLLVSAAKSSMS